MDIQITSRGCSRAYIICVLWHGWQYVRLLKSMDAHICFPFGEEIVAEWIVSAKSDCDRAPEFLSFFGGTEYYASDASTFWTQPSNFFTWWKNNVERKSKFSSLAKDAITAMIEETDPKRSNYCKQVVALAANIRQHFDRIIQHQGFAQVIQVNLPFSMPIHMIAPRYDPITSSASSSSSISSSSSLASSTSTLTPSSSSHSMMVIEDTETGTTPTSTAMLAAITAIATAAKNSTTPTAANQLIRNQDLYILQNLSDYLVEIFPAFKRLIRRTSSGSAVSASSGRGTNSNSNSSSNNSVSLASSSLSIGSQDDSCGRVEGEGAIDGSNNSIKGSHQTRFQQFHRLSAHHSKASRQRASKKRRPVYMDDDYAEEDDEERADGGGGGGGGDEGGVRKSSRRKIRRIAARYSDEMMEEDGDGDNIDNEEEDDDDEYADDRKRYHTRSLTKSTIGPGCQEEDDDEDSASIKSPIKEELDGSRTIAGNLVDLFMPIKRDEAGMTTSSADKAVAFPTMGNNRNAANTTVSGKEKQYNINSKSSSSSSSSSKNINRRPRGRPPGSRSKFSPPLSLALPSTATSATGSARNRPYSSSTYNNQHGIAALHNNRHGYDDHHHISHNYHHQGYQPYYSHHPHQPLHNAGEEILDDRIGYSFTTHHEDHHMQPPYHRTRHYPARNQHQHQQPLQHPYLQQQNGYLTYDHRYHHAANHLHPLHRQQQHSEQHDHHQHQQQMKMLLSPSSAHMHHLALPFDHFHSDDELFADEEFELFDGNSFLPTTATSTAAAVTATNSTNLNSIVMSVGSTADKECKLTTEALSLAVAADSGSGHATVKVSTASYALQELDAASILASSIDDRNSNHVEFMTTKAMSNPEATVEKEAIAVGDVDGEGGSSGYVLVPMHSMSFLQEIYGNFYSFSTTDPAVPYVYGGGVVANSNSQQPPSRPPSTLTVVDSIHDSHDSSSSNSSCSSSNSNTNNSSYTMRSTQVASKSDYSSAGRSSVDAGNKDKVAVGNSCGISAFTWNVNEEAIMPPYQLMSHYPRQTTKRTFTVGSSSGERPNKTSAFLHNAPSGNTNIMMELQMRTEDEEKMDINPSAFNSLGSSPLLPRYPQHKKQQQQQVEEDREGMMAVDLASMEITTCHATNKSKASTV